MAKNYNFTMAMAVRNEKDLIKENFIFHQSVGIDSFLVVDDNSTDGTKKILQELSETMPIVILDDNLHPRYQKKDWYFNVIHEAKRLFNPQWMIHNDADEFWIPESESLANHLNNADVYVVSRKNLFPSKNILTNKKEYHPLFDAVYLLENPFEKCKQQEIYAEAYKQGGFKYVEASWNNDGKAYPLQARNMKPKVIFNPNKIDSLNWGAHSVVSSNKNINQQPLSEILIYHYIVPTFEKYIDKLNMFGCLLSENPWIIETTQLYWHTKYQYWCRLLGLDRHEYESYYIDESVLNHLLEKNQIQHSTKIIDKLLRLGCFS